MLGALLFAQRAHRIDFCCAVRWNDACDERDHRQENRDAKERERIGLADAEYQAGYGALESKRSCEAEN